MTAGSPACFCSNRTKDCGRRFTHMQQISPAVACVTASHDEPCRDPDADVLALVERGDLRTATTHLMARPGDGVYRYCCDALRDATLAEDVLQQVFIATYRSLRRFARRSTVRVWLFGIARHRVLDAVKQRRHTKYCVDDSAADDVPDP